MTKDGYACRKIPARFNGGKRSQVCLHRLLLGIKDPKVIVDHKDRDKMNNRIGNLRVCVPGGNQRNRGANRRNKSGFKGVIQYRGKWRSSICIDRKITHLGTFDAPEDAAIAYDTEAKLRHGEFAYLNFP